MLEAINLCKSFGALAVTDHVSFRLEKGERRAVLGPNGAGKTTLFNLLTGQLSAASGEVWLNGTNVTGRTVEERARMGLARSFQKNSLFNGLTIGENLSFAAAAAAGRSASLLRDSLRDKTVCRQVTEVAAQVGLLDVLKAPVAHCSYGTRRQLEVGIALASSPTVLLLDEPASGAGPLMIEALHALLKSLPRDLTILIIEHDMDLALDVADRITVLNYGKVVFEGTPEETRASPLVNEIYLGDWDAD
ncbi:MAG: ABC transporter ATP-binding protein, partial [Rhodomicrobium sp.]